MNGGNRSLRARLAPLRRRAPAIVAAVVLVTAAAIATASLRGGSYTAEAIMLVPSGSRGGDPGRADEAAKLAATYALAIPQDARIRRTVATKLGVTTRQVRTHMFVANDANTALLRLRYTSASRQDAVTGAAAMSKAVLDRSAWRTIKRGSLVLVRPPDPLTQKKAGLLTPTLIGLMFGIFLAIIIVIALERSDIRIDDSDALAAEVACPVSALDDERGSLAAVVERWRQLLGGGGEVAILPCTTGVRQGAREVAALLVKTGGAFMLDSRNPSGTGNSSAAVSHSQEISPAPLFLSLDDPPGSGGENRALHADLTALVVAEGTPAADVRQAVELLHKFGVSPVWMFLVRSRTSSTRRRVIAPRVPVADRGPAEA
jgi:capsular polysaccharide biosynthesis protein